MFALLALAVVQGLEPAPPTPFDKVIAIEITASDPILAGHGPSKRVEYEPQFSGTLHLWTKVEREFDLFLRLEEEDGKLIAEDDNSGGGNTPYLKLDVEPGRKLWIDAALATGAQTAVPAALELHAVAAPETRTTRDAAAGAQDALTEMRSLRAKQEIAAARELAERVLAELLSVPGASASDAVADSAWKIGFETNALSLLTPTRRAWRSTWEHRSRTLPADHSDLQWARGNLANTMYILGDLAEARALQEQVLEVRSRTLPADHHDLQAARLNFANTIKALGDLAGARALQEQVLEVFSRTLPADHPDLLTVRHNLALTIKLLGDLAGARALQEQVLEAFSRTLPDDHPDLQTARLNLANTIGMLGDLAGARELQEQVLEIRSRTLSPDHPDLQAARASLATTLWQLDDRASAKALFEVVLEVCARTLPADNPDLQTARQNLAVADKMLGDLAGARSLEEQVLEVRSRTLPADHPELQTARQNLAATMWQLGDLASARSLLEQVLDVYARTLPDDHPELQKTRVYLAGTIASQVARAGSSSAGERESEMKRCVDLIGARCRADVQSARALIVGSSSREAEERCSSLALGLDLSLSFAQGFGVFEPLRVLGPECFVLCETTRGAGLLSAELTRKAADSPKYSKLRAALQGANDELAALVRGGTTSDEFDRARTRRDSVERELVALAGELSGGIQSAVELDVRSLAARLGERAAAVGFRRYENWRTDLVDELDSTGQPAVRETSVESLCAFVVRGDARAEHGAETSSEPTLVDLGPIAPIEAAVHAWRDGLGVSSTSRGIAVAARDAAAWAVRAHGAELRGRVFDPLLPALANSTRIVFALDDVLHVVPLDALPVDDETLLGDRWRIETRATLSELFREREPSTDSGSLVAIGDVEYGADESSVATGAPPLLAATNVSPRPSETAPRAGEAASRAGDIAVGAGHAASRADKNAGILRGSAWSGGFSRLVGTGVEVRGIARCFADQFGSEAERRAIVLEQREPTREALQDLAPKARYVHIATHGWFAPESIKSWSDPEPLDKLTGLGSRLNGAEQIKGMSPMLLCGLALAGANLPADAVGRMPGLVTAEEIATLDLSNCELVVLSACDTNVGERRAGQGVASLQKALQMAGARSVITSLWKVPDEATKELMLDFYRRMWVEKKPKWQALWEAKKRLREAKDKSGAFKYSTRDWAAWVLTGNPE